MPSGINPAIERHLATGFNTGYANAVTSFRKLLNERVSYHSIYSGFLSLDSPSFIESTALKRKSPDLLLTTEVFGELTGKSYLLIPETDYATLTKTTPDSDIPQFSFKDEFAKELDNILSAAVITELSNELKLKIYGDVPILVGKVAGDLKDIILSDFSTETNEIFVTAIGFTLEDNPTFNPAFVWVLNSHILRAIAPHVSK